MTIVHAEAPKYQRRNKPRTLPADMPVIVRKAGSEPEPIDQEEHRQRTEPSEELWRELMRRATRKD